MDSLTTAQLDTLRSHYAKVNTIDPSSSTYKQLVAKLNNYPQPILKQLADAKIKFVSGLAKNRVKQSPPVKEGGIRDVDHMNGSRGINLPSVDNRDILAKSFETYGNLSKWKRDVALINSKLLDDNAEFTSYTEGEVVSINNKRFASWSNRNGNGTIDVGVAKRNASNTNESTGVTDYSGKLGGNRNQLLAKLRTATSKQEKSELATQARKAGATQRELQAALKTTTNLPESANDAEHYTNWHTWNQAVRSFGGTTEHVGGGRYDAVFMDDERFGVWDENTGEGYIDFEDNQPHLGNNDSLGEASETEPTDAAELVEPTDENPRDLEKEEPSAPKFDWVSKFDLGEIKEAMQKIVDHLADTDDEEQTDLLRNDIRILDNLHDALRKQDGVLIDKMWTIAKSEGSAEHLHDEFAKRMDDACATVNVEESVQPEKSTGVFVSKEKWLKAAKKYRVKESNTSASAFSKDTSEMVGRWSGKKGWLHAE